MKDTFTSDPLIEDIAALIDEAIADPASAGAVKARVRARLASGTIRPVTPDAQDGFDGEDLWDNLPL